jgi:hypothetical protein
MDESIEDSDLVTSLSPEHRAILDEFAVKLQQDGTLERCRPWRRNRDYLRRFLFAADWSIEKANENLLKTLEYREKEKMDTLVARWAPGHPVRDFCERYTPQRQHGVDATGLFVFYERSGSYNVPAIVKAMSVVPAEDLLTFHLLKRELMEESLERASRAAGKRIAQHLVVIDMKGLSMSYFNTTFLDLSKNLLTTYDLLYPELSRKLYIVNTPWIFSTLWSLLRQILPQRTIDRVEIDKGRFQRLREEVSGDEIPREIGGECEGCRGGV